MKRNDPSGVRQRLRARDCRLDFPLAQEIFPAASYQYVYYGMGGETAVLPGPADARVIAQLNSIRQRERSLAAALPTNRAYLSALAAESSHGRAQGERR